MKEFFKKMKQEKMTNEEKNKGLNSLKSFLAQNPASVAQHNTFSKKFTQHMRSPFYNSFFTTHRVLIGSISAFILLIGITGGTSRVAQYSLPGDLLYPVKINLNEKLESFMSFDIEAKALIELKHLDTRLMEAETLDTANKLDGTRKKDVESQFKQDLRSTINHINSLQSEGDTKKANKVKINMENSLNKYKGVVDKILEKKLEEKTTQKVDSVGNSEMQKRESNLKIDSSSRKSESSTEATTTILKSVTEQQKSIIDEETKDSDSGGEPKINSILLDQSDEVETPTLKSILDRINQ